MFRRYAIAAVIMIYHPHLGAQQETPLRSSIRSILALQSDKKEAGASGVCDAAIPLARDPAAAAMDQAMLLSVCGNVFLAAGDIERSRTFLERALRLWENLLGANHKQVAATMVDLATAHRRAGRYELSLQYAQNALRIYEANKPQVPMLSQTLICLAAAETMLGRYAEAESNLSRVLSLLTQASMENGPEAAAAHSALGMLYFRQRRYFDAERSLRRAIAGSSVSDAARILANLAQVYVVTKSYYQAETTCYKAINMMTRTVGGDNAEVGAMIEILANVRAGQKRYGEAAELLRQALEIPTQTSNQGRLYESTLTNNIGVSQAHEGRYTEAEAAFRKAIAIEEVLGNDARGALSASLHNLAMVCGKQGRYSEALEHASRAFAVREAELPDADSTLLDIMLHKAQLLRKLHRKSEAAKLEHVVRQMRAERKDQGPQQWTVDFRELQNKK